jgi:hypothetical protein
MLTLLTYKADSIELEMKKGEFRSDNRRFEQMLTTIMNHSAVPLSTVTIECGFFHDDLLIGRDMTMVGSLQSGQDACVKMTAYVISATRTDCRFGSVSR